MLSTPTPNQTLNPSARRTIAARSTSASPALSPAVIERARQGDREALGVLFEAYAPSIRAYLLRRTGDRDVADDLAADVFLRVVDAVDAHRAWRDSFTGWLYRIAHNVLVDFVRTSRRRVELELPESLPCPCAARMESDIALRIAARDLDQAIETLRPTYARILRLRFGGELTHAEVGSRIGKTADNVKVTQTRALAALRRRWPDRAAWDGSPSHAATATAR